MDADVLKARRARWAAQMPDTAKILRVAGVKNRSGGATALPAETGQDAVLKARCTPMRRPRTQDIGNKPTVVADWEITIAEETGEIAPADIDVRPTDTVQVGKFQFRVVDTDAPRSDALCLTITALRFA